MASPDTPLSPTGLYNDDDSNEPQAPATGWASGLPSESSDEDEKVHLPDTFPSGTPGTSSSPSLGPQASIPRIRPQASIPRIRPQTVIPGIGPQQSVIPGLGSQQTLNPGIGSQQAMVQGIGIQAAAPQIMPKQETGLPSKTPKHDGDVKISTAATVSTSKPLPGIGLPVAASRPESKEEISLSSTLAEQMTLSKFSDIPKKVQQTRVPTSERVVASNIFPSNNPQSTDTSPITKNFKFTLELPVPHELGHAPAEKRFSFTSASKARLGEIDFPPVRRPVAKPNRLTQPKGPEASHFIPVKVSALTPQDNASEPEAFTTARQDEGPVLKPRIFPVKPSLADAFTPAPQAKKVDEEPMFAPVMTSLVEPSTPIHKTKKLVEEPQFIPIKPLLAESSVSTRQASQFTEFPQSPAVKPPVATRHKQPASNDLGRQGGPSVQTPQASQSAESRQSPAVRPPVEKQYKRPNSKDVGRQDEETADAEKKIQAQAAVVRQLVAEKRELRSERDAISREKAGLQTKLRSLNDVLEKVEGREGERKKTVLAKSKEVADLMTENDRLKKEMEALSLLAASEPGREKISLPARTEIPEKSPSNESLLAEKAKEIDNLNETIKLLTKERDPKAPTRMEVLEWKAKLRKAEDDLIQKKKDEEYVSKRTESDAKKIKDLSDELTKAQLSRSRMETEFKAQTVQLNKAKTREAEAKSKEDEVQKLGQNLKKREAEVKSTKEQAEKLKKGLEVSKDEVKSAKAQNDKLAKDLEESNGRTLTATASADLKKIATLERGQIPQNQPDEIIKEDKRKICDLTADNEVLRKALEEAKQLAFTKAVETDRLKADTPSSQSGETSEEDKRKTRDLRAENQALRKELEEAKQLLESTRSVKAEALKAVTPPAQPEETRSKEDKHTIRDNEALRKEPEPKPLASTKSVETDSLKAVIPLIRLETNEEEAKQKTRDPKADKEALRKDPDEVNVEMDGVVNTGNQQIESLTAQNKALAETCQDLNKKISAQTEKLEKLTTSNEELSRKLQKSEEGEERGIRKVKEIEKIYKDVLPVHATNAALSKQLQGLRTKLARETEARTKSESHANLQERKLALQLASLRETSLERAELISKVGNQEAELAKYADARKSVAVEAELEETKTMMGRERAKLGEADAKRELNMKTTLDNLEQNERERRQKLVEEVETKARLLYKAEREILELNGKLAASEEETKTALAAAAAAGGTAGAPPPSKPSQSSPSPPADPSSATAQSSLLTSSSSPTTLPTITTTAAAAATTTTTTTTTAAAAITAITAGTTTPWFQLQRFHTIRIQMTISPRRILIILLILVLAFLGPYFHSQSLNRQAIEEREMWRAANEISRQHVVEFGRSGAITGGGSASVAEFGSAG